MYKLVDMNNVSSSWHSQAAVETLTSWGMYHRLRLSQLAQINGNWERQSSTTLFLSLSTNPGPGWALQCLLRLCWHHLFNWCTHRFRALLTLSSKLLLCTAKSIDATTSSFNVAAVFSIRSSQRLFGMCIPVKEHQRVTLAFEPEPTF